MRIRQSMLGSADKCLLAVQHDIQGPPDGLKASGISREVGTGVHAALEWLYLGAPEFKYTTEELVEVAIASVHEAFAKYDLWQWSAQIPDMDTADLVGRTLVEMYMNEKHWWPVFEDTPEDLRWQVLGCEVPFEIPDDTLRGVASGNPGLRTGTTDLVLRDTAGGIVGVDHKAQPLDSHVLTPSGWMEMGRLRLGDLVITESGESAPVVGIHPQGVVPIFKVSFSDGSVVRCCDDHLWKARRSRIEPWRVRPLSEMRDHLSLTEYRVPNMQPSSLSGVEPDLDGYVLGALLGDGCLTNGAELKFSSADMEVVDRVRAGLGGADLNPSSSRRAKRCDWTIKGDKEHLRSALSDLNMLGHLAHQKSIPEPVFWAPHKYRLDVLRGLMDTDGHAHKTTGTVNFCSTAPGLVRDIVRLVRSLGGSAYTTVEGKPNSYTYLGKKKMGRPAWRVTLRLGENPFYLERKAERYEEVGAKETHRRIVSVEPDGPEEAQCITVDHPTHTYVTDDYIVTHNTAGRNGWAEKKEHPRKNNQAPWYVAAYRVMYPEAPAHRMVFDILNYRPPTKKEPGWSAKFERRISNVQQAHIDAMQAKAQSLAFLVDVALGAGVDLPANPANTLCNPLWCDHWRFCRHGAALDT